MLITLLILALISVFAIILIKPPIGLYLMAFFLPLTGWSFSIYNFVIPFIDLVALIVLSAFALRRLFFVFFNPRPQEPLRWPLFFPFAIFLLICALSALLSQQPAMSLWYIVRWPLFLYFSYIFLSDNLVTNAKILKHTLIALTAGTFVVLISAYLSLYGQDWHNSFYQINSINWWGIYPFGENHNVIAEFLNIGAFIILSLKILTKDPRAKRLLDIVFVLTALAIILTFSRAAWITLLLQILVYIWYYLRAKNYRPRNIVSAGIILLILLSPLAWKMNQFQQDNASSTASRWLLTEISWQAFLNKPYLGYGSGEFMNLVDNNIRFIAKYGAPIDSHGFLQKIIAENGGFGLAAWLFIIAYLLKAAYQSVKKYQSRNPWLLPLWLAAGGGLFFQIFNTSYYQGKIWLPIALALTAVRLLSQHYERNERTQPAQN